MAQLRSVTGHMGSHSVTCYPTQVNTPRLHPSHAGRYSIYLPRRDKRLSWPSWLDSASAGSRTCDSRRSRVQRSTSETTKTTSMCKCDYVILLTFLPRDASAERGYEIACRLSLRLSVCL